MIEIPVAQAHNRLSALIKRAQKEPVMLTLRGKAVGVILSVDEYEQLRKQAAYQRVLQLSKSLRESGLKAQELYRASRDELEEKA
jgi:prevent-host-death family protein